MSRLRFKTHLPSGRPQRCGVFKKSSAALCHVWSGMNAKPHTAQHCLYLAGQICRTLGIHQHLCFIHDASIDRMLSYFFSHFESEHFSRPCCMLLLCILRRYFSVAPLSMLSCFGTKQRFTQIRAAQLIVEKKKITILIHTFVRSH